MTPEHQAVAFLNSKQDAELEALLKRQPSAAVAAHIDLDRLAGAGLARSYVALIQIQLAKDPNQDSTEDSAALAAHSLVTDMPDQDIPFVCQVFSLMASANLTVSQGNEQKDTPLHLAARAGRLAICQSLVQCGADVLARNDKNRTPAGQAKLDADVKEFLIDAEAAAKEKRQKGSSALWDEKMKATQTESAFGVRCL